MLEADIPKDLGWKLGQWAPQEVLPSPGIGTVIPFNDTGCGLAVQNTAL